MFKLDPDSREIVPSSVDFFNSKPNLIAFQQTSRVEYHPQAPLGTGSIHFNINAGQSYVDLSECQLITKFKLTKKADDQLVPITKDDPVSFVQAFGGSFIKNLKVSFNGRSVYNSNDLYAYNFYLRRRLGLDVSRDESNLQIAGYFEDGLDQMSGPGFEARRELYENDATFETSCSIDADIFRQKKLLLNQTIVDIELSLHNNFFALLSSGTTEYKYHLVDCRLYVKQHTLLPQLDLAIQESLNKDVLANYGYTRTVMKNMFISQGRYDYSVALFNDFVPKRVFAALVDAKAFTGHIGMSPFDFKLFDLASIQVDANGTLIPTYPYKLDNNHYTRAYSDLNKACPHHGIDIRKFAKHSCIFAFDLYSQENKNIVETQRLGSTSIKLSFNKPVPINGLQLIILGEFDSILAIDKTRTVTTAMPV